MEIYELKLVEKIKEFRDIYTFRFSPATEISFRAGQWIHFGFPSAERDKTRVRHLSFASAPDDKLIEFSMDLSSGSWFKNRMRHLKEGDVAKAFKIVGRFTVEPDTDQEIMFIAGGIGIVPVRSILRDISKRKATIAWKLLHVSRHEFLYEKELKVYKNDQWRVDRSGLEGKWDRIIENGESKKFYISGSDRFVRGIAERLENHNIPTDRIVIENFGEQKKAA